MNDPDLPRDLGGFIRHGILPDEAAAIAQLLDQVAAETERVLTAAEPEEPETIALHRVLAQLDEARARMRRLLRAIRETRPLPWEET